MTTINEVIRQKRSIVWKSGFLCKKFSDQVKPQVAKIGIKL